MITLLEIAYPSMQVAEDAFPRPGQLQRQELAQISDAVSNATDRVISEMRKYDFGDAVAGAQ